MDLFGWIRRGARDAFKAGIGDAIHDLTADGDSLPLSLESLQERLALPAPADDAGPVPMKGAARKK